MHARAHTHTQSAATNSEVKTENNGLVELFRNKNSRITITKCALTPYPTESFGIFPLVFCSTKLY